MPSYYPSRQADLRIWALNFSTLLTAAPATYGETAGVAAAVSGKFVAFDAALSLAIDPSTKTKATVSAKDLAKAEMMDTIRPVAMRIRNNAGVLDSDKISIGLTIPDLSPTPVAAPTTQPILNIVAATPQAHVVRFADATTPDKRAKPIGTIGMQLFRNVGAATTPSPDDCDFVAFVTKQPFQANFDPEDVGKRAYYYARWQTRTGLVGPWSLVASMTVAG